MVKPLNGGEQAERHVMLMGHSWVGAETTNREDINVENGSIPDDDKCNENDVDGMNDEILIEQHRAEQWADAVKPVESWVHQKPVSVTANISNLTSHYQH